MNGQNWAEERETSDPWAALETGSFFSGVYPLIFCPFSRKNCGSGHRLLVVLEADLVAWLVMCLFDLALFEVDVLASSLGFALHKLKKIIPNVRDPLHLASACCCRGLYSLSCSTTFVPLYLAVTGSNCSGGWKLAGTPSSWCIWVNSSSSRHLILWRLVLTACVWILGICCS